MKKSKGFFLIFPRTALIGIFLVVTCSCGLLSAQEMPSVTASSAMSSADSIAENSSSNHERTGLTLEECLALALKNNLEIRAQKNAVDGAFQKMVEQTTLAKPRIGAQQIYSLQGKLLSFGEARLGDKETSITQLSLTQPVYTFGRLEKGLKMIKEEFRAEDATFAAAQADVLHRVIRSYLDVLKNGNRIRIASETIQVLEEHLKLVESLFSAGVVLKTDVSMTKVKMLEARQGLIEAQNAFDVSRLGLLQIVGLDNKAIEDFQDIPLMPLNASTTLNNPNCQPEIKKLDHLIKMGKYGYELAKINHFPNVGLQGTWSTGNQFFENFKNWNANIVLDFPFFDSGSTSAKKKQAFAALEKLKNLREDARQKFDLAISRSARNVRELQEKFALARQIEATARENYENLQSQYREGAAINTDVLSAQLSWSNARIGVNNAYYDYVAYLADHYYSLGNIDGFIELVKKARMADSKKGD